MNMLALGAKDEIVKAIINWDINCPFNGTRFTATR